MHERTRLRWLGLYLRLLCVGFLTAWRAASNPAQHTLFIDFTIWANAAHGIVMVIATPLQKSLVMTFIEGVPLLAAGRRAALSSRADGYDAAIILGCDAAVETARSSLASTDCRTVPGMEVDGIMNVVPTVHSPLDLWLELKGISPVAQNRVAKEPS